jgi:hypothetical protein
MILLYNVYLDDKVRRSGLYFRGLYGENISTIDVFKYTLNSVVNIYNWKKRIVNVNIHDEYNEYHYKNERDLAKIHPFTCGLFHGKLNNNLLLDRIKKSYNI